MIRAFAVSYRSKRKLLALATCVLALWPLAAMSDASDTSPAPAAASGPLAGPLAKTGSEGVPGYLDAATGTFQRLSVAPASVTRSGTIQIVGTLVLNPGIPANAKISVMPYFRAVDALLLGDIFGVAVTAKRTGPHSATFSATLRYTCLVPNGTTPVNVYADITTSAPGAANSTISWDGSWGTKVTLPADGKTLTIKANAAV